MKLIYLTSMLSFGANGCWPVHRKYMTQPSVQQSILKSLCRNFRVSGALHSFRPVPPVIFEAGFSTYTATLKSISLTLSGCQRRQPSSPLPDAVQHVPQKILPHAHALPVLVRPPRSFPIPGATGTHALDAAVRM